MDLVVANQAIHENLEDYKTINIKGGNTQRPTFLACIGAHEFVSQECSGYIRNNKHLQAAAMNVCRGFSLLCSPNEPKMWRAALTELVATATLIFILTTSIISCLDSHEPDPKLLVPFIVFTIVFLFLMVTVPLSGGHMSPVFTFIAALKGIITIARASIYIMAQCIGAIIAFIVIQSVMSHQAAEKYSLGGCVIASNGASPGLSSATALILEFSCTFVVLYVGVTVAFDKRRCKELGLVMVCVVVAGSIALVVFVSITVTGRAGYAGVGLNPARCLGPALLQGGPLWDGHWVFWVGPFFACIVYYGFSLTLPKEGLVVRDEKCDFVKLAGACWWGK